MIPGDDIITLNQGCPSIFVLWMERRSLSIPGESSTAEPQPPPGLNLLIHTFCYLDQNHLARVNSSPCMLTSFQRLPHRARRLLKSLQIDPWHLQDIFNYKRKKASPGFRRLYQLLQS